MEQSSALAPVLGARTAAKLADKLRLTTVGELLRYYPRKYDERGKLTDLAGLVVDERATVWAKVRSVTERQLGNRRGVRLITNVVVGDGNLELTCTFFNQHQWKRNLPVGTDAMFSGKVTQFRRTLQMTSPSVVLLADDSTEGRAGDLETIESFAGGIIPVYPLVEGIGQSVLQKSVDLVLQACTLEDPLPDVLAARHGLTGLARALQHIHRPGDREALAAAQHRLRYDEALSVQLVLAARRAAAQDTPAPACPERPDGLLAEFNGRLPFTLTRGQTAVGRTISGDLAQPRPMNRLLQGEVGSGKTIVALRAMLQVIDAGRQTALLAPTEVLAAQHARSLRATLGPLGRAGELDAADGATRVVLLTGSLPVPARRKALLQIVSGEAGIVVGTHALLSAGVDFADLGLVVVDEQHRFGVEQRDTLRTRRSPSGTTPHVLVMTATPIPRTVAMTVYGDLDTSILSELPAGRSPITTTVVPVEERPQWLDRAWQRVREEVGKGHQVYVVCPKIGDEPERGAKGRDRDEGPDGEWDDEDGASGSDAGLRPPPLAVVDVAAELADGPLAGLSLGVVHGRLPPAEKDQVMRDFGAGDIDVLVATTVIEVGVDVPNASMMVIMDAERFGMSQLHQLRGRVGRGSAPGICLLVTRALEGGRGRARLAAVAASADGFELAEADLAQRREGDVLGTVQSGKNTSLRQLSLLRDREVIEQARADAGGLVGDDPTLASWPGLARMVADVIAAENQEFLEKA
ncbi:ATP-dependent DNA helicase RecG [Nakamurella flavida]|nr:ATP-dependent DNA helicase RecG [Nakamurella flavida]MDP9776421.1 ATP-dependent DNA helicase RecG [Nakamurella flavida]